jgi:hypothetical protein
MAFYHNISVLFVKFVEDKLFLEARLKVTSARIVLDKQ